MSSRICHRYIPGLARVGAVKYKEYSVDIPSLTMMSCQRADDIISQQHIYLNLL